MAVKNCKDWFRVTRSRGGTNYALTRCFTFTAACLLLQQPVEGRNTGADNKRGVASSYSADAAFVPRAWRLDSQSVDFTPALNRHTTSTRCSGKKRPNDPYTNLMRGISAQRYWYSTQVPGSHEIEPGSPKYNNYYHIIRECLAKAVKLAPDNAIANMNYGFFPVAMG